MSERPAGGGPPVKVDNDAGPPVPESKQLRLMYDRLGQVLEDLGAVRQAQKDSEREAQKTNLELEGINNKLGAFDDRLEGHDREFNALKSSVQILHAAVAEVKNGLSGLSVLIVDDNVPMAKAVRRTLRKANASVTIASRLAAAQGILLDNTYDVLLVDVHLEPGNGLTLIRDALAVSPKTVIIVMTADPLMKPEHAPQARHFFYKPFELEVLVATLKQITKERETESTRERETDHGEQGTGAG